MIKIAVVGANGKMGREVINLALNDKDLSLVCAVDKTDVGKEVCSNIKIDDNLDAALTMPDIDIVVDFTQPSVVFENAKKYLSKNIKAIIGTTGLTKEQILELEKTSNASNCGMVIAPNFSLGAVLMMKFSKEASKYFSNAEIIEYHHNQKKDAPSGTSIKTAQMMIESNSNFKLGNCDEKETISGARGAEFVEDNKGKIQIHAVRMPGFVASQEVIFGSDGQIFKIKHDTINRSCYMSGVKFAIEYLNKNNNFVYGLENIL